MIESKKKKEKRGGGSFLLCCLPLLCLWLAEQVAGHSCDYPEGLSDALDYVSLGSDPLRVDRPPPTLLNPLLKSRSAVGMERH